MKYYHGSNKANLNHLKPFVSEHEKAYVYFSTNPVLAALYCVHVLERPLNWFPYGFDGKGRVVYEEYYENALMDVYAGQKGYLYVCEDIQGYNPTGMKDVFVSEHEERIIEVIEIEDMGSWFMEKVKEGELVLHKYEEMSPEALRWILHSIEEEFLKYHVEETSQAAQFYISRFPQLLFGEEIETERLRLRKWRKEDVNDLYEYACDAEVGPMAGWKPHESIEESAQIIELFIRQKEWAIELKENHKVIGSIGFHQPKIKKDRSLELGYVLSKNYWGQGLMSEAVKQVCTFAFERLHQEALFICCFDDNVRSARVAEKCGFQYYKHLEKAYHRYDGIDLDEHVFILTKKDANC